MFRAQNGNLISAPGSVDIIGDPHLASATYARYFNTCYQNTSGVNVVSTANASGVQTGCSSATDIPVFRQRLSFTSQNNSNVLNVRQRIHPLLDASLFKQFIVREGVSFEIRGEFFNILNTPNFGGPNTSIGGTSFGAVTSTTGVLTQANDPRIGQLTARVNF